VVWHPVVVPLTSGKLAISVQVNCPVSVQKVFWISQVSVFHCYVAVSAAPFLSDFNFPGPLRNANDFVVAAVDDFSVVGAGVDLAS